MVDENIETIINQIKKVDEESIRKTIKIRKNLNIRMERKLKKELFKNQGELLKEIKKYMAKIKIEPDREAN